MSNEAARESDGEEMQPERVDTKTCMLGTERVKLWPGGSRKQQFEYKCYTQCCGGEKPHGGERKRTVEKHLTKH